MGTPIHVRAGEHELDAKMDRYIKGFKQAMQELFPKPTDQMPWTMPGVACFSVGAHIISQNELPARIPIHLPYVSSVVADKAGEFLRYLAMELRPGETLTVTVERHEDVPISQAAPVVMPR